MRKLIAFLLICLLSLQAAFAAAGSACLHEQEGQGTHFGHHAHEHRLTAADPAPAADTDPAQDHDCTSCHANALSGVPVRTQLPALPAGVSALAAAVAMPPSSPPPWRPERPNWSGTA